MTAKQLINVSEDTAQLKLGRVTNATFRHATILRAHSHNAHDHIGDEQRAGTGPRQRASRANDQTRSFSCQR